MLVCLMSLYFRRNGIERQTKIFPNRRWFEEWRSRSISPALRTSHWGYSESMASILVHRTAVAIIMRLSHHSRAGHISKRNVSTWILRDWLSHRRQYGFAWVFPTALTDSLKFFQIISRLKSAVSQELLTSTKTGVDGSIPYTHRHLGLTTCSFLEHQVLKSMIIGRSWQEGDTFLSPKMRQRALGVQDIMNT